MAKKRQKPLSRGLGQRASGAHDEATKAAADVAKAARQDGDDQLDDNEPDDDGATLGSKDGGAERKPTTGELDDEAAEEEARGSG